MTALTPRVRLALAVPVLVALVACGEGEAQREAEAMKAVTPQRVRPDGSIQLTEGDRTALALVVAPATEANLPESVLRFGRIVTPPANEAQVVSPVTGRVRRPPSVQLGATVAPGATLLEVVPVLDAPERISVGTQAAERQGQIEAAEGELIKAEADAARARELSPHVVSVATLQQAETAVATARARLEALRRARAVQNEVQTEPLPVRAPIAGRVVSMSAEVGALVKSGDVIARLLRPGPLWVDIAVPPDEPPGDRYELVMATGPIPARLLARGGITEPDGTRHDRLVIDAAVAAALTPGATVSVRVGRGRTRGIVLPESAIVPGVDTDAVYIEIQPGVFVPRPVRVAARFGGQVRLSSGLSAGERVVIQGAMGLQGEAVRALLRPTG